MATAMVWPEPTSYRRGGANLTEAVGLAGPSPQYVSYARTVLRFAPEAVALIMAGALTLDAAYQDAKVYRLRMM